jgi:hypothetical protein
MSVNDMDVVDKLKKNSVSLQVVELFYIAAVLLFMKMVFNCKPKSKPDMLINSVLIPTKEQSSAIWQY